MNIYTESKQTKYTELLVDLLVCTGQCYVHNCYATML